MPPADFSRQDYSNIGAFLDLDSLYSELQKHFRSIFSESPNQDKIRNETLDIMDIFERNYSSFH